MKHLTKLFRLIELTRSQPQYGYALAGIPKDELSDLAQHHYLVAFIAWQLASSVNHAGGKIDIGKVLQFALIHDLAELLGGDISMPYAKANPRARKLAKAFESENQRYLAKFFGKEGKNFKRLAKEVLDAKSDEALIAKLADYIEVVHYKIYVGRMTKGDVEMSAIKMKKIVKQIGDAVARLELAKFTDIWARELKEKEREEFFESVKGQ